MIEAFDEVMGDKQAVEECKVWLLKQKQTQDWKTTKATADAVYGLLLRGRDLLASDNRVEVTVGGMQLLTSSSPQPSPSGGGSPSSPRSNKTDAARASAAANVSPSPRGEGRGEGKWRDEMTAGEIRNPKSEIRNPVEPGTGFYERRFVGAENKPKIGEKTVKKMGQNIAWWRVHWPYLQD